MPQIQASPRSRPAVAALHLSHRQDRVARVVREMLIWRGEFDASQILVEARHSVVILSGRVATEADAREACRLARSVLGVAEVDCQLEIG